MSPEKLVYMANQIATFFNSQPGDDQVARIAAHLGDFWEPRMIDTLRAHLAAGGTGLDPRAEAALDLLARTPAKG
ncbi:MAG: formate dehydrogenase subunit delta [Rhodobacteraceae bacterium]|nr:formate dehydrogenase subunit delta [Paracoccaceae bacterium]